MNKEKKTIAGKGISLKTIGIIISSFAFIISALLIGSLYVLSSKYRDVTESTQHYMDWKNVANDIQLASDYLTDQVRSYVVVGKKKYMDNYFEVAKVTKRRDKALEVIKEHLEGTQVYTYVVTAITESNNLMELEYKAMRLVADVKGTDYKAYPEIINVTLSVEEQSLDDKAKLQRGIDIVYGETYIEKKDVISFNINHAVSALDTLMEEDVLKASKDLKKLIVFQQILIGSNVVFLVGLVIILFLYFVRPVNGVIESLNKNEEINIKSTKEFNFLAKTYNKVHSMNQHVKEKLIHEAEHDKLTGLYNRTGYDSIYRRMDLENVVYVLIDVDNFKQINDKYGHMVGDKTLVRVSKTINKYFDDREDSFIFRIGGDEFSIIIENETKGIGEDLVSTLKKLNAELSEDREDIPGLSLSIGVAHGKAADTTDTLFRKADKALYKAKKNGRNNIQIFE